MRIREGLRWGVLYVLLACALLPELTFHIGTRIATGDGSGDAYQNLWYLWWVGRALQRGLDIYHTDRLFWPVGTSLVFHTLMPVHGVLSLPAQALWPGSLGLVVSLNVLTLSSFALTGFGAHLVARQHGATLTGACAAGLLAMTVPYRFWHLNHLNLLSTHTALFTLWLLHRSWSGGTWRAALGLGLCAAVTTYTDYEIALYTAVAGLVSIAWYAVTTPHEPQRWLRLAAAAISALLLHLPLLGALLDPSRAVTARPPASDAQQLSANLLAQLGPAPMSLLWAPVRPFELAAHNGIGGDEAALGPVFVCALLGLACLRRERAARLWLALGALFVVLSLGPSLRIGASTWLTDDMPYAWLTRAIPALSMGRSPVRMGNMAAIFLAIALGLSLARPHGRARLAAWSCVLGLLALERTRTYAPALEDVRMPRAYLTLAAAPEDFAIMPTPVGYVHQQLYMFWQTLHGKALTTGGGARTAPEDTRFLQLLASVPSDAERMRLLHEAGVRYVVVHTSRAGDLTKLEPRIIPVP